MKEALKLLPDEVEIIDHLGDLYVKQNKIKEAGEMYERALKIDSKNVSIQKKLEDLIKKKQ